MGRKDGKYSLTLHERAYKKMTLKFHFGESKREAKADGTMKDKIFSPKTFDSYWKEIKRFIAYVERNHPECKTLPEAKRYETEWLKMREEEGKSAWTIWLEYEALNKLYGKRPSYVPPKRHRSDIKRSRGEAVRDKHFSEKNHQQFVNYCLSVGQRRFEVEKTKGKDLVSREEIIKELEALKGKTSFQTKMLSDALLVDAEYYVRTKGKGGRLRMAPIIGPHADQVVERMKKTPPESRVWLHVPDCDIHGYRAKYATFLYKMLARPIESIPKDRINKGTGRRYQSEVYVCRKDEYGKKLDKCACLAVTAALGHSRIEIMANNYLREI